MAKRERQCTSSWLRARDTRQSVKNSSLVKATEKTQSSLKITNSLQKVRDKTQSSLKITNSLQKMRGKTQSFFNTSLCQKRVTRQSLYKNTSFIAKSRSLHIFHSKRDVIIVRLALEINSTALSHKIK